MILASHAPWPHENETIMWPERTNLLTKQQLPNDLQQNIDTVETFIEETIYRIRIPKRTYHIVTSINICMLKSI
jgi:hypothetical protein